MPVRRAGRWALIAALALGAVAAWSAEDAAPSRHEQGRKIFNFRCYFCHGYSGDAKTLAASFLSPKPTDFTHADPQRLTPDYIATVIEQGRPGTAMKSFRGIISADEIKLLADFVAKEFVERKAVNTRYHTVENGWPNHERYAEAFPFATGEIPLSQPWESLTPKQTAGKRLYLASCVSCHDRGAEKEDPIAWDSRPLSYPRNNYLMDNHDIDAMASASPYAKHDVPPKISKLSRQEKRGERLFLRNCAFCHGADGTGKNWIGSFLEPHPRNLTDPAAMSGMTRARLTQTIANGLPGTSMPAWRDVLNKSEIEAVAAYVNRAFHPLAAE